MLVYNNIGVIYYSIEFPTALFRFILQSTINFSRILFPLSLSLSTSLYFFSRSRTRTQTRIHIRTRNRFFFSIDFCISPSTQNRLESSREIFFFFFLLPGRLRKPIRLAVIMLYLIVSRREILRRFSDNPLAK